jgi:hypothetical protein
VTKTAFVKRRRIIFGGIIAAKKLTPAKISFEVQTRITPSKTKMT